MTQSAISTLDIDRTFQKTASRFLATLDTALRQAQLYEQENKVLVEPVRTLVQVLDDLLRQQLLLTFRGQDENVLVNKQRLRCDGPTFLRHRQFLNLLKARKISGMVFHAPLDSADFTSVLYAIARFNRESATVFEEVSEAIKQRGLHDKLDLLPLESRATLRSVMRVQVERRAVAVRTYAKTMFLLKLYIEHLDDATRRSYYHLKLQRAVQDLVTVCLEDGWKYFGLVNIKHYEEYLYNHSINVAVLSLVMGVKLKLRRSCLVELGMAAILHDLGKALLPKDLMESTSPFTDEDRARLQMHPLLGVKALLRGRQFNEALLKQIAVICQHHEVLKTGASYHAYSRIIAVAETFDALISKRPYRPAYLPDDAIKTLIAMAGTGLDQHLVAVFVQTVGLYPAGTLVELSTGEKAIVFHPHPDPCKWKTPIVRIIRDREGGCSPLVDLSERLEDGSCSRTIVRILDPAAVGINVSGYLYTEADSVGSG